MDNYNAVGSNNPIALLEQMIEQATDLGIEVPQDMLPPIYVEPVIEDILDEVESRINLDSIEEIEIIDENVYYYNYENYKRSANPELSIDINSTLYDNKNFCLLLDVLEDSYGTTFDIKEFSDYIEVIIYYSNITIRNTSGNEHNIKSLFVKIQLLNLNDCRMFKFIAIKGARFYITDIEYHSKYRHSHLRSTETCKGVFSNFCIGYGIYGVYCIDVPSDNKIGKTYIGLSTDIFDPTIDDIKVALQSFFIAVDNYVQWESAEGGPYIAFSSIGNTKEQTISITTTTPYNITNYDNIYRKYILELEHFIINSINFKYDESNRLDEFLDIYSIERIINAIPIELSDKLPTNTLCIYKEGKFYKTKDIFINDEIITTTFSFRNKPVKHIIKAGSYTNTNNLLVNPSLILAIIAKFKLHLLNNV